MWLRTAPGAHDVPVRDYFPDDVEPAPAASGLVARDLDGPLGRVRVLVPRDSEPRVLMLHGVSLDSDSWTPLLRAAARAGEPAPPWLLVDVPGFGGSDRLPPGTSLDRLCDAVGDVLEQLCTPPVHLVGHSMGGFAALHLAATRGDLLRSLAVLNGSYATIVDLVNHPVRTALQNPSTWLTYTAVRAVAGGGDLVQAVVRRAARRGVLGLGARGLVAHPRLLPRSAQLALAAGARPASFRTAQATGRGYDCAATWARIGVPVLAGYGASDALVTARDAAVLRRALPRAREVVVDDASHLAPLEQPDRWYAELTRFWAEVDAAE